MSGKHDWDPGRRTRRSQPTTAQPCRGGHLPVAASSDAERAFLKEHGEFATQSLPSGLQPTIPSWESRNAETMPLRPDASRWSNYQQLLEEAEQLARSISPGDEITRLHLLQGVEEREEIETATGGRAKTWRRRGRDDEDEDGAEFEYANQDLSSERNGLGEVFRSHGMIPRRLGSDGVVGRPKAKVTPWSIARLRERLLPHCGAYTLDELAASLTPGRPSPDRARRREALIAAIVAAGLYVRENPERFVRTKDAPPRIRRRSPERALVAAALGCSKETVSALKRDAEQYSHEYPHKGGSTNPVDHAFHASIGVLPFSSPSPLKDAA